MLHRAANRHQGQPSSPPAAGPSRAAAFPAAGHAGDAPLSGQQQRHWRAATADEDIRSGPSQRSDDEWARSMRRRIDEQAQRVEAARVDAQQARPAAAATHSRGIHSLDGAAGVRGARLDSNAQDDPEWYQRFRNHIAEVRAVLGSIPAIPSGAAATHAGTAGEDHMDIEAAGDMSAAALTHASGSRSPEPLVPDSSDTNFMETTWRQLQSTMFHPQSPTHPPPTLQRAQTPAAFRGGARGGRPRSAGASGLPAGGLQSIHPPPARIPLPVPTLAGGTQAPTPSTGPARHDNERLLQLLRSAEFPESSDPLASTIPQALTPHRLGRTRAIGFPAVDMTAAAEVPMVAAGGGDQPAAGSHAHAGRTGDVDSSTSEGYPSHAARGAARAWSPRASPQPAGVSNRRWARHTHEQRLERDAARFRAGRLAAIGHRQTPQGAVTHIFSTPPSELVRVPRYHAEAQLEGRALRWEERALMRPLAAGADTRRATREPHLVEVGNLC